jgi:Ca2+/H+ antiporter
MTLEFATVNVKVFSRGKNEQGRPLWTMLVFPIIFVPCVFITQFFFHGRTPIVFVALVSIATGLFARAILTITNIVLRKRKQGRMFL